MRRLSSRLNSASGGIIAVRLLHGVRESVSRIDDSPANRPQTDPAVFGRGEGLGRGLVLGRGPVRRSGSPVLIGQIGSEWAPCGGGGGGRPRSAARWTSAAGQVTLEQCRWRLFHAVRTEPSNRCGGRDLVKGIGDSGRKQGQTALFVSIMPHFGLHYLRCPTNPWGVGRVSGVV